MINFMKMLYDCGAMSDDTAKKMGVDSSIIEDLIRKEQLIVKVVNGKTMYKLNDFGENVYRMETGKKLFFRCENWTKMDSLSNFYAGLSQEERDSWKNKDAWYYEGYVEAIPDATFLKDGEMYGVYTQSDYTTKKTIEQVEAFARERRIKNISYIK